MEDGDRARNVLEAAGFKIEGDDDAIVLYIPGEDRPGTIGRGARKIADPGVNIRLAYLATRSRLVFVTSDNVATRVALKE